MKLHEILTETYINLFSSSEKSQMIDDIWPMIEQTYANIGGLMGMTKENLINTSGIWKLDRKGERIISGVLYKDLHGRKVRLVFHDGTQQGKDSLKRILSEDIFRKRSWGEFSGPLASVLIKLGAKIIPAIKAKDLLNQDVVSDDGKFYTREVSPNVFKTQILLGNPVIS